MGTPYTVTLDVRLGKSTDPGWKSVKASDGSDYSFLYAGGSDGNGNVDEKVGSPADVTVNLICDPRYRIYGVYFKDDNKTQLSVGPVSDRSAVIHDRNDKAQKDAYYGLLLKDTGNSSCTFDCDPKISNDP